MNYNVFWPLVFALSALCALLLQVVFPEIGNHGIVLIGLILIPPIVLVMEVSFKLIETLGDSELLS